MLGNNDGATLTALIKRSDILKNDYMNRHKYWQDSLTEGSIKSTLLETSYRPAVVFFETMETKFIPAVKIWKERYGV